MDKSPKNMDTLNPEEEIDLAVAAIESLYGFTITRETALHIIPLYKEMGVWLSVPDDLTKSITKAALEEKSKISKKLLSILVNSHKPSYEPALMAKLAKIFELQYSLKLDEGQLRIAFERLSKSHWMEMGPGASVEKCLSDLMDRAKKHKWDEKIRGKAMHTSVRKTLDEIASILK